MEKRAYYHLFSDGFRADFLFEDKSAFISGMNIIAFTFLRCDVMIYAFCLMDNHVHFILYGTLDECNRFQRSLAHQYSLWYFNRYGIKSPYPFEFEIKMIDDERYLLASIAYVLRNGISAGFTFCIDDYIWSSNGLYFRDPVQMHLMTSNWKKVSDLSTSERRHMLRTRVELPPDWLISPNGFIWPGNYVDYKAVEAIYRSPKSFAYFMGQRKEDEINEKLGIIDSVFLPDVDLREKAVMSSLRLFRVTDLRELDVKSRILLAKELHKEYRCSYKQIARIVHLNSIYLKELV